MLRFSLYQVFPDRPDDFRPYAHFDDEPEPKRSLLGWFIMDFYGQEDLCLAKIAEAEAGETVLDLYNNLVDVQLYPDGRVVLEEMRWSDDDEAELGPPLRAEITLAELKQLIPDWLAAKQHWQEQKAAAQAAAAGTPPPSTATPQTPPTPPPTSNSSHNSLPPSSVTPETPSGANRRGPTGDPFLSAQLAKKDRREGGPTPLTTPPVTR